jgi:hypothetical protein
LSSSGFFSFNYSNTCTIKYASFSCLFRSKYKWILYLTTMYVYCVYPAMSKKSENLSDLNKKDRKKCHSSPFINVVKGVFFVVLKYGYEYLQGLICIFILQSVHLLYKYAIRINFCFIHTRRINFSYYTNKLSWRYISTSFILVCALCCTYIQGTRKVYSYSMKSLFV